MFKSEPWIARINLPPRAANADKSGFAVSVGLRRAIFRDNPPPGAGRGKKLEKRPIFRRGFQ